MAKDGTKDSKESKDDKKATSTAEDALKKLNMKDVRALFGEQPQSSKAKPHMNMDEHKFWGTQPVTRFDEKKEEFQEGPIQPEDPSKVPKEPYPLVAGFEWVTMDMEDEKEVDDVYQLLYHNYVEDDEAMFRFKYSASFLNWALKSPGWRKQWHVGIRAAQSRKLVAFISGVPITLLIRPASKSSSPPPEPSKVSCSEVNFLCVHKKLRGKRLAPVLIKEITRRCHEIGIWQAIYTAGTLIPTPMSTCRYYHRSLDWEKLESVGFTRCPPNSTRQRQITRYRLPSETATPGVRDMEEKDIPTVTDLLMRYLQRFRVAQQFSEEEVSHWLINKDNPGNERVVYAYVVEDPTSKTVTDFFSFYRLESTIIGHKTHDTIRAAYNFYYASKSAFSTSDGTPSHSSANNPALKKRLNALIHDALILAKSHSFDVFNALTLLDNPLFLDDQKFGAGDGNLHYYLYNYRVRPVEGGVGPGQPGVPGKEVTGFADEGKMGGVGMVML